MPDMNVQVRVDGPAGSILLDRPGRRNALSRAMIADIEQAFSDLHQQKSVRSVILSSTSDTFCAGMDLHEIHKAAASAEAMQIWMQDAQAFRELLLVMLRFPKPIIASVNGAAMGGGAGLVLASDFVIAGNDAKFAIPAPQRGLVAGLIAPLLFFRTSGSTTSRLMLDGRAIDAQLAQQLEIFHEVVAPDMLWARSHEMAQHHATCAAESLAMTKRMINETIGESLSTLLSAGAAATATSKTTAAGQEGVTAFVEKRPPVWP